MDLAYRELLQSTIVKVQHDELKLGIIVLQKINANISPVDLSQLSL